MEMKKTDQTFINYNDQFINGVLNGRHPNSYPRKSELYEYCNNSSRRVQFSSQGKDIFDLSTQSMMQSSQSNDLMESSEMMNASSSLYEDEESTSRSRQRYLKSQHDNQKLQDEPRIQTINGIKIETSKGAHIHYGMSVVIKSYAGEIMCVNKFDELRSKPLAELDADDKIVFQIIDIRESSNAASVNYGDPIWIKAIDNYSEYFNDAANQSSSTPSASAGRIVGAKIFEPPSVLSIQEQFRTTNLHNFDARAEELASKRGGHHNKGDNASLSKPNMERISSESQPLEEEDAWSRHLRLEAKNKQASSIQSSAPCDDAHNHQPGKDIVGHAALLSIIDKNVLNPDDDMGMFAQASVSIDDIASRYHSRQSTILGKWVVKSALNASQSCGHNNLPSDSLTSASNAILDFSHNNDTGNENLSSRRKRKQKLCTATPFYFEQDLYCLSVAPKESYTNWPKISLDFVDDVNMFQANNTHHNTPSWSNKVQDTPLSRRIDNSLQGFVSSSMGIGSKHQRRKSASKHSLLSTAASSSDNNIDSNNASSKQSAAFRNRLKIMESSQERYEDPSAYVVLKKIAYSNSHARHIHSSANNSHKSNKANQPIQDEYMVDRRSVFQFYSVENSQFMKDSKTQQSVRKLMDKARNVLKNSELTRKGQREFNYKGKTVYSGEQFTKSLKSMSMQNTFDREHQLLTIRRQKEQNMPAYMNELMSSASEILDESLYNPSISSVSSTHHPVSSKVLPSIMKRHQKLYGYRYNHHRPNASMMSSSMTYEDHHDEESSFFTTAGASVMRAGGKGLKPDAKENPQLRVDHSNNRAKEVVRRLSQLGIESVDSLTSHMTANLINTYEQGSSSLSSPTSSSKSVHFHHAQDEKRSQIPSALSGMSPPIDSMEDRRKHLKININDTNAAVDSTDTIDDMMSISSSIPAGDDKGAPKKGHKSRVTPSRFITTFKDVVGFANGNDSEYHKLTPGEQILLFRRELELANIKAKEKATIVVKSGVREEMPSASSLSRRSSEANDIDESSSINSASPSLDSRLSSFHRQQSLRFPILQHRQSVAGNMMMSAAQLQRLATMHTNNNNIVTNNQDATKLSRGRRERNEGSAESKFRKSMMVEDSLTEKGLNFRVRLERYEAVEALLTSLSRV